MEVLALIISLCRQKYVHLCNLKASVLYIDSKEKEENFGLCRIPMNIIETVNTVSMKAVAYGLISVT